jgi:hypothetical protein
MCRAHLCLGGRRRGFVRLLPNLIWDAIEDERSNPSLAWKNILTA